MRLVGWSSVLAPLVAAVAGQTTTAALSQSQAVVAEAAAAYPVIPPAGTPSTAPGAAPKTFNPMEAVKAAAPQEQGTPAVAAAVNAAINGNKAALDAVASAAIAQAPIATGQFVEGFIDSYFDKVTLEPGEKICISRNAELMTQDSVGIITQLAVVIGQLVAKEAPNVMALMGGAGQVVEIVTSTENLIKQCVRADAVAVMKSTLAHLKDPTYVKGRLLANGLEIAGKLADSIPAYEASNFKNVGADFGSLLRKVLLSRNSGVVNMVLPQGMAQSQVGEAIVNGVISGMFVAGTSVNITSKTDPTIAIFVDLHRCIAREAPYFSAAANALYLAIAQLTTNIEQWQLKQEGIKTGYVVSDSQYNAQSPYGNALASNGQILQPPGATGAQVGMNQGVDPAMSWMNQLSGVMTNIPVLMTRCGFNEDQRIMLSKALKDMDSLSVALTIPGPKDRIQAGDMAATKFEEATKAWEAGNYQAFGDLLGGLMRDMLLTIYPQNMVRLYNVDHGELGAFLKAEGAAKRTGSRFRFIRNTRSLPMVIGSCCAMVLFGLAVVRMVRPSTRPAGPLLETQDEEAIQEGLAE